jgi:hypothetical protein
MSANDAAMVLAGVIGAFSALLLGALIALRLHAERPPFSFPPRTLNPQPADPA